MSKELPKAEVDVAVLILFFNRPTCLKKVFDEVKKARPARLFLYQDGPRGEHDMPGITACREVVADIDWQCDVRRNYRTVNAGCDPSEYLAQRWAFSLADKCIVLEDDDIPSPTFIPFCKALLDRYEYDERIGMIAGFNTDEVSPDVDADYFFTSVFSIWGWASWRRVIDRWDKTYAFLDDENTMRDVRDTVRQRGLRKDILKACYSHRASGREYYETIFWSTMVLNHYLAIMPAKNMINNLGPLAGDTVHYNAELATLPRDLRRTFTMGRHDIDTPIRHPEHVIEHVAYRDRNYRLNAYGHPWIKVRHSLEELVLNLRHGNFAHIGKALKRRIAKWTGTYRYS